MGSQGRNRSHAQLRLILATSSNSLVCASHHVPTERCAVQSALDELLRSLSWQHGQALVAGRTCDVHAVLDANIAVEATQLSLRMHMAQLFTMMTRWWQTLLGDCRHELTDAAGRPRSAHSCHRVGQEGVAALTPHADLIRAEPLQLSQRAALSRHLWLQIPAVAAQSARPSAGPCDPRVTRRAGSLAGAGSLSLALNEQAHLLEQKLAGMEMRMSAQARGLSPITATGRVTPSGASPGLASANVAESAGGSAHSSPGAETPDPAQIGRSGDWTLRSRRQLHLLRPPAVSRSAGSSTHDW